MNSECDGNRRAFLQAIVAGTSQGPLAIDGNPHQPPSKPKIQWTVDVEESVRVREALGDTVLAEGEDTVWALSTTDGTVTWKHDTVRGRLKLVGVDDTVVYVKESHRIYAISRSDGSVLWTNEDGNVVTPNSSTIYVTTRSAVKALDAKSGTVRWKTELTEGQLLELGVHESSELVYVGDTEGTVHAVSMEDGTVQWRFETPNGYHVRPISPRELTPNRPIRTAEMIIIWNKREQRVHALSSSGEERWRFETNVESTTFPGTFSADNVLVVRRNTIHSLGYNDGRTRWQYEVDEHLSPHPRTADESVYVNDQDGNVHALRITGGTARWVGTPDIGTGIFVGDVGEGVVTVSNIRGEVAALSDADGELRWRFSTDSELQWFPQTSNGMVYVGTDAGKISALDLHETRGRFPGSLIDPALVGGGIVGGLVLAATYYLARGKKHGEETHTKTTWNDFELLELEDGPTETAYRARAPDGEVVALERFDGVSSGEFAAAIETWLGLDHEGILPVREWGTDPEPWVATAYPEGGRLIDNLDELDRDESVEVVSSVAETVHRAHREGVAHGRLHPGNVLFGDADRDDVLVSDWLGAATRAALPRGYAAPEQDESAEVGVATDVYQLGALGVHVLTGEPPSGPEIDAEGIDEVLVDVLETALATDPGQRYGSALRLRDMVRWAGFQQQ
jgi:outer membrane protein assembly factor BamB